MDQVVVEAAVALEVGAAVVQEVDPAADPVLAPATVLLAARPETATATAQEIHQETRTATVETPLAAPTATVTHQAIPTPTLQATPARATRTRRAA